MRKSEERYRLLADNVNDVIWAMDRTLALFYISPSVEKLSGYTAEEVMVLPIEKVFTERSFAKLSDPRQVGGDDREGGETRRGQRSHLRAWVHPQGRIEQVGRGEIDLHPGRGRKAGGGVGVARDITERKRQEEPCAEARRPTAPSSRAPGPPWSPSWRTASFPS